MKNLKTKIGMIVAAGFLASNLAVKNVNAEYKPDPNIKKLVDTIFEYPGCSSYKLPDGRIVKFEFYGSKGSQAAHFSMDLVKEAEVGGEVETVRIRDCYLDGLGKDDLVGYKMENKHTIYYEPEFEFRDFTELSKETQEKLRKEYNKIVKEAPDRIVKEYQTKELQKIKEKDYRRKRFEENILDLLKSNNQKPAYESKFSPWVIA